MLSFLACLLVVSLYVLPYYLLPFPALRGHRDAPRTIRTRALCSFGSCAAISALLFAVVAARLRFDDGDLDGDGESGTRRHLVEARLALASPSAWLRASFPLWAVRSLAPSLAEALATSLGAGKGAASAWRTAAAEAAEEAARLRRASEGGTGSAPSVPSPAAAVLRLLGLRPLSAAGPGAAAGVVSMCCLLAWPLSQRAAEAADAAFEGGGRVRRRKEKQQQQQQEQRRRRLFFLRRSSKRGDSGAEAPSSISASSCSLPRRLLPRETALRDLVIAPLTEEIAFRGCLLPILLLLLPTTAGTATAGALAASSAAFASAHLHHAAATLLSPRLPRGHRRAVALGALLQLLYTFAFGLAAGALLLASGSLAAPVAAHSLANFLGLPRQRKCGSGSSSRSSSSSLPLLLHRAEAAVGALGVAAFALMAAGCGGGKGGKGFFVPGFAPFRFLAMRVGAAGHGESYRSLVAALSLPPPR